MGTAEHEHGRQAQTFRARARRAARRNEARGGREPFGVFAVVCVGDLSIALPAAGVKAIVKTPPISVLPGLPAFMPGIAQVRGVPISIVDLRQLYGFAAAANQSPLVAVLQGPPGRLGAFVDRADGFRTIFVDELAGSKRLAADLPVLGVTQDLVHLLDVDGLLADPRVTVRADSSDAPHLSATGGPSPGPVGGPKRGES